MGKSLQRIKIPTETNRFRGENRELRKFTLREFIAMNLISSRILSMFFNVLLSKWNYISTFIYGSRDKDRVIKRKKNGGGGLLGAPRGATGSR